MKHKQTLRRGLSVLLALLMCLSLLPVSALAAELSVVINESTFPDETFRAYVSENFDTDKNGALSAAECAAATEIDCSDKDIATLTGIGYFKELTTLECYGNQLTALNVSNNEKLTYLDCSENQLTDLNVSNNEKLTYLDCSENQLTDLNVSSNKVLEYLDCGYNQLTALNVSNNEKLTYLDCSENQLTDLNVSNNTALKELYCSENQLTDLKVGDNTALTTLDCNGNKLTSLDLSQNSSLKWLYCYDNSLTSLDLSNNTSLQYLDCSDNQLTVLDVSKNTQLDKLYCNGNKLTSLDTSSTSGTTSYGYFNADDNIYDIELGENRSFDLSTLPGKFDATKASNWTGGTVEGNILTVNSDATEVTYDYDCENKHTVTFKLSFEPVAASKYTVTFDANGGTGTMTDVAGVSGDYTLPTCTFTAPEGKQFKAWSVNGTEYAAGASITVNADTTVTAIWEDIPATTCDKTADFTSGDGSAALALLNGAKTEGAENSEWDSETNTLTLKGVNFTTTASTAVKLPAGAKIVLAEGTTNTITSASTDNPNSYGIYANNGLTIEGGGTLTVTGGTATGDGYCESYGIYSYADIEISGGTVEATGGTADSASYGIYADSAGDSVTISGETTDVTATGGTAKWYSYGIYSKPAIEIKGGTVEATGGTAGTYSKGINTYYDVTISGGTVEATGGTAGSDSYGIYAGGDVDISGGTVEATGGTATGEYGDSEGIYASEGDVTISGGTVEATGGKAGKYSEGICASEGDVTISGGTIEATGGTALYSTGIWSGYYDDDDEEIYGGNITIFDTAEVTATGGTAGDESVGIYAIIDVDIKGGTVTATGGAVTGEDAESTGIYADDGNVTISGGHVIAQTVATTGNKYALNKAPVLTDYSGYQWRTSASGGFNTAAYSYSADHTYVEFSPGTTVTTYTVTFDPNGGTLTGWTTTKTEADGTVDYLSAATRDGYTFDGWYTEATGGEKVYTYITKFTADTTVYAHWTLEGQTKQITEASFTMDGYTVGANPEDIVVTSNTEGLSLIGGYFEALGKPYSYLLGTDEDEDGEVDTVVTGPLEANKTYILMLKADVNAGYDVSGLTKDHVTLNGDIKAEECGENKWEASIGCSFVLPVLTGNDNPDAKYTITFDANGGSGSMANVTGVSGSYTLPANGFTAPSGKQFKGWATSAEGEVISDATITVTENTTLYAIWEDIPAATEYNITVTDGKATVGAGTEISKAAEGTTVTLTANAAPDGKEFDKWVVESGSITLADANSAATTFTMPAGAVSVKATYKDASHTHNLSLVPATSATCTTPGNKAYYTCDGCDKWFEDATGSVEITDKTSVIIPAEGHTPSDWKSDDTDHWKECSVVGCGVIIEGSKAAHTASDWITDTAATATTDGTKHKECTVCKRVLETGTIPATGSTTEPTDPNTGAPDDAPQTGDNSNMILWIVLLLASGLGVTGTVVYSKRKKYVK